MREIEIKFRIADAAAIRSRLRTMNAAYIGRVEERNEFFDFDDLRLRKADSGVRVRTSHRLDPIGAANADRGVEFTWKGPRTGGADAALKDREEWKVFADDRAALVAILQRLGLAKKLAFEKLRETWQLDECEVVIDDVPSLGWFVEVEGPSADVVRAVSARLGLDCSTAVAQTYAEMIDSQG